MTQPAQLSIIIPLYNEEKRVSLLQNGIAAFLDQQALPFKKIEFLMVNDGSSDQTVQALEMSKKDILSGYHNDQCELQLEIVDLKKNCGKGGALKEGVRLAKGDWILTMDADIATHPLELNHWLESGLLKFDDKNAVHIASREHPQSKVTDHRSRRIMGRVFNLLTQLISNITVPDSQCGFKLYPKAIAQEIFENLSTLGWAHDVELLSQLQHQGIRVVEHPITWQAIDDSRVNAMTDPPKMMYEIFKIRLGSILNTLRPSRTPDYIWGYGITGVLAIYVVLIMTTFHHFGIIWDEPFQHQYGRLVLLWFTSLGQQQDALSYSDNYYYGGLVEGSLALVDYVFGERHIFALRKLLIGLTGLLACLGTIKLTLLATSQKLQAGFIAGILMLVNPIFFGHAFINSKDIPFATAYIWSIYYLCAIAKNFPRFSIGLTIKLGLAMGLALSIRAGAFILYFYMLLTLGILITWHFKQRDINLKSAVILTGKTCTISIFISYALMIATWPWAQINPFIHPFEALTVFSRFAWDGDIAFAGGKVKSTQLPWYYIPHLMLRQNTELFLIGLIMTSLLCLKKAGAGIQKRIVPMLLFAALFPVIYVIIKKTVLYDNYRHLLFVIPVLACLSAIGFHTLLTLSNIKGRMYQSITLVLMGIMLCFNIHTMVRLHPNQYIYYNLIAGGQRKALKNYESDYWGNSLNETNRLLAAKILKGSENIQYSILSYPEFPGYWFAEYHPNFIEIKEKSDADFTISITRSDSHKGMPGLPYLANKRYGKTLSLVKDNRPFQLLKSLDYTGFNLEVIEQPYKQSTVEKPLKPMRRALTFKPTTDVCQLTCVARIPLRIFIFQETRPSLPGQWHPSERSIIPQAGKMWFREVNTNEKFETVRQSPILVYKR